jgi:hypothetical protein
MKRKNKGKKGVCAIMLDMMKAYDRVEWPFLQAIMQKLGFPKRITDDTKQVCQVGTPSVECCSKSKFSP